MSLWVHLLHYGFFSEEMGQVYSQAFIFLHVWGLQKLQRRPEITREERENMM